MGEACDNRRGGVVREAREVPFVSSTAYSFHVKQILFTCSNGRWFALECYDGWREAAAVNALKNGDRGYSFAALSLVLCEPGSAEPMPCGGVSIDALQSCTRV